MNRQMPFSRFFPRGHSRAGESTYFVEKILNSLQVDFREQGYYDLLMDLNKDRPIIAQRGSEGRQMISDFFYSLNRDMWDQKLHTIRQKYRIKDGDILIPYIWTEKAYASPQIVFAPEVPVISTWNIDIQDWGNIKIGNRLTSLNMEARLHKYDGLGWIDFQNWFSTLPFSGQVIAWNKHVDYSKVYEENN